MLLDVGGRIAYTWNVTPSIAIIPELRMMWQHEFLDGSRPISASLDGGSGASFTYHTSNPERDSVFAGAGVGMQLGDRWNASLYYNTQFGQQNFFSTIVSASVGWKF